MSLLVDGVVLVLALIGLAAVILAVMLARPLTPPPPLQSVLDGALQIEPDGLPELSRFQARDGTWLAYRRYPAVGGASGRIVLLGHGSAGASAQMNGIAQAIARDGGAAVAVDFRGHGASGTRGDVAYEGQLDDDLADLIAELRSRSPAAKFAYVGHSSGGGYGLRIAAGPLGAEFERFVLLAPYLGHRAPTRRRTGIAAEWAAAAVPRIIAITILRRFGVDWPQSLPVLAFAVGLGAEKFVTSRYTFRLMASYAAPDDWEAAFRSAKAPIAVIAGADDELMDAPVYQKVLPPLGARVRLIPGVDHMAVCWRPEAIDAIVAALAES